MKMQNFPQVKQQRWLDYLKKTFIEMLGKHSVSVFSTSVADLHDDIKNA